MSARLEVTGRPGQNVRGARTSSLSNQVRARLRHHKLDKSLASGADPNTDSLRRERARQLVGEKTRHEVAAHVERLLVEADSPPRGLFTPRVPIARAAIRDSRWNLETIVERLKAPAYISPQGVAMISLLLSDGAGPLYGNNPAHSQELHRALDTVVDAIDNGPVLVVG
jgi:hypothetical protein